MKQFFTFAIVLVAFVAQGQDFYQVATKTGGIFLKGETIKVQDLYSVSFGLKPNSEYRIGLKGDNVIFKLGDSEITVEGELTVVTITTGDTPMALSLFVRNNNRGKEEISYVLTYIGKL